MKVTSFKNLLDEWLGDIDPNFYNNRTYNFDVRVGCVKYAPPRHERFEHIIDIGRSDVQSLFSGEEIERKKLTFIFPERFMSVHEQSGFMRELSKCENIESVDIITSCPLIISSFHRGSIRILEWGGDNNYGE